MKILFGLSALLNLVLAGLLAMSVQMLSSVKRTVEDAKIRMESPSLARGVNSPVKTVSSQPVDESLLKAWNGDKVDLYDRLRAIGAPNDMVMAIMFAHNRKAVAEKRLALLYPNGVNRWSSSNPKMDRDSQVALNDFYAEKRQELRKVMGTDFDVAMLEEDPVRQVKWGNLSPENISKAKQIAEQYDTAMLNGHGFSGGVERDALAWETTMNRAFEKDIRSALGPEAEDFLTFNSLSAQALQSELSKAGIELSEESYRAMLKATQDLRLAQANAPASNGGDDIYGKLAQHTQLYENLLGAEEAVKLTASRDVTFKYIDTLMSADGADAKTKLGVYYDYANAVSMISSIQFADPFNTPTSQAAIKSYADNLYNRLASSMSAAQFAKFNASSKGKMLSVWRGNR